MRRLANLLMIAVAVLGSVRAVANALPDPTRPANFAGSASRPAPTGPAAPVLHSTMVSPGHKSAVISGQRVRIGDTFQGAVITDITPYEVRMSRGGRDVTLRLIPKLTKEKGAVE